MTPYEFLLPDIGEGLQEAEIVSWFVAVGDYVKENERVVEVQTDKAVVEITAPVSGKVVALGGKEGEEVKVGNVLVRFDVGLSDKESATEVITNPVKSTEKIAEQVQIATNKTSDTRILAAPSVRKAARVAGIDLAKVTPSGTNGKILAKDLKNYIEQVNNGPILVQKPLEMIEAEALKTEKIKGIKKVIFENMQKSIANSVQCTGMDKVNVTKLVKVRKELLPHAEKLNVNLTYVPFFVKAASIMLKKNPIFNATVNEEEMLIVYNNDINIGIAMATEQGLIVPVIKHADKKSILEIAEELQELSSKAKERKLKTSELTGSTFTISNTGSQGGWFATPIINYPEVAIMGIHKIIKEPIIVNDQVEIGHMMGTSLTFDHRVIDGAQSGIFTNGVAELLENPELFIFTSR